MNKDLKHKMLNFWAGPVKLIRLNTFRMAIGVSLLCYMLFRLMHAGEWLTPAGFHLEAESLYYFDWYLPLLPEGSEVIFGLIYIACIVAFIVGIALPWISWIVLSMLVYVSAVDQLAFFSPNKMLILAVFIIALQSMTAKRGEESISAWPVRMLQIIAIVHIFTAGTVKITGSGEWVHNPYVFFTQVQGTFRTDTAAWMLNTLPLRAWAYLQLAALLFELLFPLMMVFKRLRPIGIAWGIGFQLMIALTMKHLIYFNLIMISFYVLFLEPETLKCLKSRCLKKLFPQKLAIR